MATRGPPLQAPPRAPAAVANDVLPHEVLVGIHFTGTGQADLSNDTVVADLCPRFRCGNARDDSFHTVTPQDPAQPGGWERAGVFQGEAFEHTFRVAGTFGYFCEPRADSGMAGTITVVP